MLVKATTRKTLPVVLSIDVGDKLRPYRLVVGDATEAVPLIVNSRWAMGPRALLSLP
jgi:hypothetical protein